MCRKRTMRRIQCQYKCLRVYGLLLINVLQHVEKENIERNPSVHFLEHLLMFLF